LKKTPSQRQPRHSVSDAERWGYCPCLDAVVPTHLTLNLLVAVMSSSALSGPPVVRVDRLQLLNSLRVLAVTETDNHLRLEDVVTHGSL
jgi:hypothetical protein